MEKRHAEGRWPKTNGVRKTTGGGLNRGDWKWGFQGNGKRENLERNCTTSVAYPLSKQIRAKRWEPRK